MSGDAAVTMEVAKDNRQARTTRVRIVNLPGDSRSGTDAALTLEE
jgi:hypothetical protein